MKKVGITLALALGLCVTALPVTASAAGNKSQETDIEQTVFVDLSDSVLQEGGYLPQTDAAQREMTANEQETSTSQEQIATKEQETPQRQITAEEQEKLQEQDFIEGETASALSLDDRIRQAQEKLMAAWDAFEDVCDLSSCQITVEELKTYYRQILNQNPKYFYVYGGYSYYSSSGYVTNVIVSYNYDKERAEPMIADYNMAVAVALDSVNDAWSDMEKALYLNDYLARNCEYDTSLQNHSAYDALVVKKAVCQGYSLAFEALAKELGLSCEMVSSDSLNHAWNLVEINGTYYHVDVTWDDSVPDMIGRARHQYFMKSTDYFKSQEAEHLEADDWVVSGGLSDAVAADTSYDDCFWNAVDMGFDYIDGYWYGFDGINKIKRYTCDGNNLSDEGDFVTIDDVWPVLDENMPGYTWQGKYIGIGSFNGKLYYSGKDAIYELNTETGETTSIFALSEEQKKSGYIYGMNITPTGEVKYILSASPSESGIVNMAASLGCADAKHTNLIYSDLIEPTCVKDGYKGAAHCMECGVLVALGERIPKLPHTVVVDPAIEPTCTTEGKTQGSHCSVCETVLEEQQTIPATGHTWSTEYTVDKEPTATETGKKSIHCMNCDETKDERIIPMLGHESHQNLYIKNKKEATCSEEGYSGDIYCIECGDTLVEEGEIIPKLPHTVVVDFAAVAPTCTTDGKTQKSHCSVCETVLEEQQTIPATGHTWSTEYTVDKEPTATETGKKSIHCINCDEIKDVQQIPALGLNTGNSDTDSSNTETTPRQITTAVITLSQTSYSYDGSAKKPSVVLVQLGNATLKSDDYTVSYQNNVNIGTATVTITGKGNYTGTAKKTFTISAKKGSSFSVGTYQYKITNSNEAAFAGLKNSKTTKVTIPATVKIGGKSFKVTSIAAKALRNKNVTSVTIGKNVTTIGNEAFRGCKKLKTITVKATNLNSVGKNALKGIKASAKIKVPSKKLAAYKELFKNKGQGKQVKITK